MERETGIEPATNSLEGCDSTTELLPPSFSPAAPFSNYGAASFAFAPRGAAPLLGATAEQARRILHILSSARIPTLRLRFLTHGAARRGLSHLLTQLRLAGPLVDALLMRRPRSTQPRTSGCDHEQLRRNAKRRLPPNKQRHQFLEPSSSQGLEELVGRGGFEPP